MLNASLLNRRMYNSSPQYLLLLDKSDSISTAEYIRRVLKCYTSQADSITILEDIAKIIPILYSLKYDDISIAEDISNLIPILYSLNFNSISISEDIQKIIPILYSLKLDNISISDIEDELVQILYKLITDNISISEYERVRLYIIKWRFRNLIEELDFVNKT